MSEYIFADHSESSELSRLKLVEAVADPISIRALNRAAIAAGSRCLELGSGAGSILRWIGSRVGTTGSAVGVDRKVDYLADCSSRPYRIIEGDVPAALPDETFDAIHARYMLIHNRGADAIINALADRLRPGGVVVLVEPDFTAAKYLAGPAPSVDNVNTAMRAMFADGGLDPAYGLRLPDALSRRGLQIDSVELVPHVSHGGTPTALMMAESARALRSRYTATGLTTEQEIDRYVESAFDEHQWSVFYTTVSVVARKPAR